MPPFLPLQVIKGVGPKRAVILAEAGIRSIADLYDCFPRRYLDRTTIKKIGALRDGETVTVVGSVTGTRFEGGGRGGSRFKAQITDGSGVLELTWFRGVHYFSKTIRSGELVAAHGRVTFFGRTPGMQHPDFDKLGGDDESGDGQRDDELYKTGAIIPIYPTTEAMKQAGLNSAALRRIVHRAFREHPLRITEYLSPEIIAANNLMPIGEAYRQLHFPDSAEQLERARYRMKWSELFFAQLFFALRRTEERRHLTSVRFERSGEKTASLHERLPFTMTSAQKQAVREIYHDLKSGRQMNRLLQGDVGSGKTLVAQFAMTLAVDNGLQAAFMAPTEILAFQHYAGLKNSLEPLGIRVALLTGRQKKKEREEKLARLERGEIDIAVGTHAIIEAGVQFRRLGLVIIDEQHRFGVLQRKALQEKAENPHVLLMTATPIPRTLTMGIYGDLDVSIIAEMPAGRKPIQTRLCCEAEKPELYRLLRKQIAEGRQAYIVYPLVEESEKIDLKAATESYEQLRREVFPELRLGLIHGQLPAAEKEAVMAEFRSGRLDILVGTTVIEVGVDVPNATIMVIEHAERFGISQLHQLRGRVGRGEHASSCFLVYTKLTGDAKDRLQAMAATGDGFRLSEIDLQIRGAGNMLGREQSGAASGLRIADLLTDGDIMRAARAAAFELIRRDETLTHPENALIRDYYMTHFRKRISLADVG
ncbi:MAG TPA: DNA helicase RecG [Chlorobaculum sp.]|uniref:ATP-dependent DNA helicase RecG n=1 Tax=Chlorobaculum tepidum (strain ATCC 49652 / DSM 12025 / NBRC 103806 / TLS) TaxID=194439 RepID=Q8KC51_CHLTE|nr:ATP-dependent DNA helicase RecG [Chlorobaculum tepidum]AAM72800.1 ATP-dependent DNA helicase RecG [Chlorobaculum tepidum TLS]HBU22430.1 DNA helicase RecG [Chlorobaculum sp.]